jgi:hypothetical protein
VTLFLPVCLWRRTHLFFEAFPSESFFFLLFCPLAVLFLHLFIKRRDSLPAFPIPVLLRCDDARKRKSFELPTSLAKRSEQ